MKIFLTGSSSSFAQALLPVLCAHSAIGLVTGVDARGSRYAHEKFRASALDIRDTRVFELMRGHDALVNLASVVVPAQMTTAEMADLNVRGAHRLFHEARAAGVERLLHMSSAAVYGEAIHANEQAPLKPLPGFLYAEHQTRLEKLLEIDLPDCVRLRPQLVVGPHAHPAVKRLFTLRFYLRLAEPRPLIQCVHEDDLASAVLLCLTREARGAYNIAAEDSFSVRDAIRMRHRLSFGIPVAAARLGLRTAGRVCGWSADPGLLKAYSHTLLVNSRRAIIELGWRATVTGRAALASM